MASVGPSKREFVKGGFDALTDTLATLTNAQSSSLIQSNLGKWAQATGEVINVSEIEDQISVSILLKSRRDLYMLFDKGSIDALALGRDDEITVQGRITPFLSGLSLTECEIISHKTASELRTEEQIRKSEEKWQNFVAELNEVPPQFEADQGEASEPPDQTRTRNIGTAEMRRFAKLYLEIWGEAAKEIPAWQAMKASYPDGIIGRDPFLKEFRELRGTGKRGNPSIRDQSSAN